MKTKTIFAFVAAAIASALAVPAKAQSTDITLNFFHAYPSTAAFLQPVVKDFMRDNPGIAINLQVPAEDYAKAHQTIMRDVLTNNLPDIYLPAYSWLRPLVKTLEERGLAVNLQPFMDKETAGWTKENYAESVLNLGQVEGKQFAVPFNASTPILYVNADLVTKAGGSMDKFPDEWQGVIDLANRIKASSSDVAGLNFSVGALASDWYWQLMVLSQGGRIVNADETGIGFDNETGLKALQLAQDISLKTGMTVDTSTDPAHQQFFAGKLGMVVASPSGVANFTKAVGGRFDMRTVRYPMPDRNKGGLPTGGNAVVILAQEPAKQDAAWKFVKYLTSAKVQAQIAQTTGYMPTNRNSAALLTEFYAANPNFRTVFAQMDNAATWYAYPNNMGSTVWKAQAEILDQLQRGALTPKDALARMAERVAAILKKGS
ncbi:ABC transporter substrate-binding protein [Agrobacterium deltaense]|nr:ABC transporter substrate-binding protein [Agrobacterium tumefaciens]